MIIGRYLTQVGHYSLKGFILYKKVYATSLYNIIADRMASKQLLQTDLYIKTCTFLCQESIRKYFFCFI